VVPANGMSEGVYFVEIPGELITKTKTSVKLGVYSENELLENVSTNFLGPASKDYELGN
jgi:hypothetical protein